MMLLGPSAPGFGHKLISQPSAAPRSSPPGAPCHRAQGEWLEDALRFSREQGLLSGKPPAPDFCSIWDLSAWSRTVMTAPMTGLKPVPAGGKLTISRCSSAHREEQPASWLVNR